MDLRTRSQDGVLSQVITDRTFRRKDQPCNLEGCRSTWYRWDLERGFAICRNGHEHPEIRMQIAAEDIFEVIRGDRVTRKKERVVLEKVQLRGEDALELYLLAWQLVLRKQIQWLVRVQRLPGEHFERLNRELWGLRLDGLVKAGRLRADANAAAANTSSGGETSEDDRVTYSSQDFSTSEGEDSDSSFRQRTSRRTTFASPPRLVDAVALCYLTCFILRLPITLADFMDWVQEGKLLYYRSILEIPRDMRDRMASEDQRRLDPDTLLTCSGLQQAVFRLAVGYQCECSMILPALNHPLHAFRLIYDLSLPIHVYSGSKALCKILNLDFRYPKMRRARYRMIEYPELQLLGLIVVAVKLLYPFDGLKRFPMKKDEPAIAAMDWETWAWTRQYGEKKKAEKAPEEPALSYSEAMRLGEADMDSLSTTEMDAYLDFYSNTFGRDELRMRDRDIDFRQYLLDLFPVDQPTARSTLTATQSQDISQQAAASTAATTGHPLTDSNNSTLKQQESLSTVLSALKIRPAISVSQAAERSVDASRPGDHYARYRTVEELAADGQYAKLFHKEAAKVGGVDIGVLVRAVYQLERRMEVRAEGQYKKERADAEDNDGAGRRRVKKGKGKERVK